MMLLKFFGNLFYEIILSIIMIKKVMYTTASQIN